jgi:hypothetical protein
MDDGGVSKPFKSLGYLSSYFGCVLRLVAGRGLIKIRIAGSPDDLCVEVTYAAHSASWRVDWLFV